MSSTPLPDAPSRADVERLSREIAELKSAVERLERHHTTQLTRIGQLQADIDLIRSAWTRIKPAAS